MTTSLSNDRADLRVFVALRLPETAIGQVVELTERLRKAISFTGCRPRWVAGSGIHLTLAFLGNQPRTRVDEVAAMLADLAQRETTHRLELRRLGVFPHWRRPSVLWVGVRDRSHRLADMHRELNQRLAAARFAVDRRPFQPHITIARFRNYVDLSAVERLVFQHSTFRTAIFNADALVLYQSILRPEGAEYVPLTTYPLQTGSKEPTHVQKV